MRRQVGGPKEMLSDQDFAAWAEGWAFPTRRYP